MPERSSLGGRWVKTDDEQRELAEGQRFGRGDDVQGAPAHRRGLDGGHEGVGATALPVSDSLAEPVESVVGGDGVVDRRRDDDGDARHGPMIACRATRSQPEQLASASERPMGRLEPVVGIEPTT